MRAQCTHSACRPLPLVAPSCCHSQQAANARPRIPLSKDQTHLMRPAKLNSYSMSLVGVLEDRLSTTTTYRLYSFMLRLLELRSVGLQQGEGQDRAWQGWVFRLCV